MRSCCSSLLRQKVARGHKTRCNLDKWLNYHLSTLLRCLLSSLLCDATRPCLLSAPLFYFDDNTWYRELVPLTLPRAQTQVASLMPGGVTFSETQTSDGECSIVASVPLHTRIKPHKAALFCSDSGGARCSRLRWTGRCWLLAALSVFLRGTDWTGVKGTSNHTALTLVSERAVVKRVKPFMNDALAMFLWHVGWFVIVLL